MKKHSTVILMAAFALATAAANLNAQDANGQPPSDRPPRRERGTGPGGPGRPGEGQRPPPPIIAALDVNHDGVIDEQEIANASAALRTLDKNGDGKLTMDELRPPRPEGAPEGAAFRGPQGAQGEAPSDVQRPHRPAPDQQ